MLSNVTFNFYSNLIIRAICNFGRKFMVIKTFKFNDPIIILIYMWLTVQPGQAAVLGWVTGQGLIWNDCKVELSHLFMNTEIIYREVEVSCCDTQHRADSQGRGLIIICQLKLRQKYHSSNYLPGSIPTLHAFSNLSSLSVAIEVPALRTWRPDSLSRFKKSFFSSHNHF